MSDQQTRKEPELRITPCLSSAKRQMRIWIFEPLDIGVVVGVLVFGKELISIPKVLMLIGIYTVFIAFYKFNKPAGYTMHMIGYHMRPKIQKPGKNRKTPRFFNPTVQELP